MKIIVGNKFFSPVQLDVDVKDGLKFWKKKNQVFVDKSGNGAPGRVVCVRRGAGKGKIHEITFYLVTCRQLFR